MPDDDGAEIASNIRNNKRKCGSDGSVHDQTATYGYYLHTEEDLHVLHGAATCPDNQNQTSSLRAELYGALSVTTALKAICLHNNILGGFYRVYIDNKEVISRINATQEEKKQKDHITPGI